MPIDKIRDKIRSIKYPALALPYLVLVIFVVFPLLRLFHYDFWDGSRIAYAQDSNDFTGVHYWLSSASLEGQYFQEKLVNSFADLIGIPALFLDHLLVIIGIVILIREVMIVAREYLSIRKSLLVIPGLIVSVFPSLSLTVSSILTFYITSLSLGWLSARKFATSQGIARIFFLLAIIFTFEYGVMILVCPTLVLFYWMLKKDDQDKKDSYKSVNVLVIFLCATGFKLVQLLFNQPDGPMLGYNQLKFPTNLQQIIQLAYGIKSFSSFMLYPILVIIPVWLIGFSGAQSSKIIQHNQNRIARIFVIALLISSITPYLMVGKSTSLFWLDFWTGRHSFALIPAIALFSVSLLDWMCDLVSPLTSRQLQLITSIAALIVIGMSTLLLERVLFSKYLEEENRLAVIHSIKPVRNEILPGVAKIYVKNSEYLELNPDEANYLMYKVKGNRSTYAVLTNSSFEAEVPKEVLAGVQKKTWALYDFPKKVCITEISISRVNYLSHFPKINLNPAYMVNKISSICPK